VDRYEFIRMVSADFSIATLCELMQVSRTAYYRYLRGASYQPAPAKQEQLKAVEEVFWQHKRRYGQRRLRADLRKS
jgi:putative transposase